MEVLQKIDKAEPSLKLIPSHTFGISASFLVIYLSEFSFTHQKEMAEAIPFGLARKIIEKLSSTTFEEIGSIWGVKDELERLKNIVSTIQAVLQDAEEQQDRNHQFRDWLKKLRDAVYGADDLLSDFSTEDLRRRVMGGDKMAKKVHTFFLSSNQIAFYFKMAHKLMAIRERLDGMQQQMIGTNSN